MTNPSQAPILCLVTNREESRLPLPEAVEAAVAGGVDRVQFREQGLEDKQLLELAEALCEAVQQGSRHRNGCAELWVNRRIDLALVLGADGVHLGTGAIPLGTARQLIGPNVKLSCATHTIQEVAEAGTEPIDLVQLAPIFAPLSKPSTRPALGCEALTRAAKYGVRILAQGGITPDNCHEVLAAGAVGVAVTGAILQHSNPQAAAQAFRRALDTYRP